MATVKYLGSVTNIDFMKKAVTPQHFCRGKILITAIVVWIIVTACQWVLLHEDEDPLVKTVMSIKMYYRKSCEKREAVRFIFINSPLEQSLS
jgi:hypothetical protein